MRHSAAQRRLDEPSKAHRVLPPALALQTKGVRSREHRIARVTCRRRERERWSALEILHEAPNVSDDRLEADGRRRLSRCFMAWKMWFSARDPWSGGYRRFHRGSPAVPVHQPSLGKRSGRNLAYLYLPDDSVFVPNVRIQVQVLIFIELLLLVSFSRIVSLDGLSNSLTAKYFKEDTDEDEEEGESAGSSNGKAVDAKLELADDDREVTQKRGFQAYERSHRIGPIEHVPVLLLDVLDLGHLNVELPSQRPNRSGAARPDIAPNEPNVVFCSTFRRAVGHGHHARCLGSGEMERREKEIFLKASAGTSTSDGAGTMTLFGTAGQSLGSGSGGRVDPCGVLAVVRVRTFRVRVLSKNRSSLTGLISSTLSPQIHQQGRLRYGTQLTAMVQIGDGATVIEARPKIAGKRGARQPLAARELPRGHPRPAGQARRVCAICEREGRS
ncbi:hypothetical protein EDB89DRAFT_2248408 [Lactarius sanguifluus]|nr:hypothetical protein EDB89DRAFT_2248408 [Lactarius sanguifluus]